MHVVLGADHAGYDLKKYLIDRLLDGDRLVYNLGTDSKVAVDYPDYASTMARLFRKNPEVNYGILICGSGIGMSMVANRFPILRAALCTSVQMAVLARMHNNANVLCLGARSTDERLAGSIVEAFLNTEFEGGRHALRLAKFS